MNIYIPDELKTKMDGLNRRVKWSKVAQRAFDKEINIMMSQMTVQDMEMVVERLSASKALAFAVGRDEGLKAGLEWAMQKSEYKELQRLDKLYANGTWNVSVSETSYENMDWFVVTVACEIYGDGDYLGNWGTHPECASKFWNHACGIDQPSRSYVEGFVESAIKIWRELEGALSTAPGIP